MLGFFADLGFVCPPRKDPGSFLQEVTTPAGQLTYATKALLEERQVPESLRNPRQLISQPPTTLLTPVADIAGVRRGQPPRGIEAWACACVLLLGVLGRGGGRCRLPGRACAV